MDIKDIKQARYCPLHLPTRDHQSRMICFPIKKVEYFLNSSTHWREKRNIECPKYSCPSHTVVEARGISMALSASLHNMLIDSRKNWRRGGGVNWTIILDNFATERCAARGATTLKVLSTGCKLEKPQVVWKEVKWTLNFKVSLTNSHHH